MVISLSTDLRFLCLILYFILSFFAYLNNNNVLTVEKFRVMLLSHIENKRMLLSVIFSRLRPMASVVFVTLNVKSRKALSIDSLADLFPASPWVVD